MTTALACAGNDGNDDGFGVPTATSSPDDDTPDDESTTSTTTPADTSTGGDVLPPECVNLDPVPGELCFTRSVAPLEIYLVALGDLDDDDHLDLVATTFDGSAVVYLRGDGTGNFAPPVEVPILEDNFYDPPTFRGVGVLPASGGPGRLFVRASDLDDEIWWSRGLTGLDAIAPPSVSAVGMHWAFDDLDANGDDDVLVIMAGAHAVRAIPCDATTCGEPLTQMLADAGNALYLAALSDFDGDGAADLVGIPTPEFQESLHARIWLNDGTSQLVEPPMEIDLVTESAADFVVMADVDGDGLDDLVIGSTFSATDDGGALFVFPRADDGFLPGTTGVQTTEAVRMLAAVDVESDGTDELVTLENTSLTIHRLGEGGPTPYERLALESGTISMAELATGDIDEDGVTDFALSAMREDETVVLTLFLSGSPR